MNLISALFSSQDIIFSFAMLILIAIYGLFALIVAIQINNLNRVVTQIGFAPIFNILALLHLFGAIALLILSVLSL